MDRSVVEEKLESLRRCLARIEARCPPSLEALEQDIDAQDIVSINLTRAVQLAVDLAAHILSESPMPPPATMAESFIQLAESGVIPTDLALRLKSAVGFRNIAVHSYRKIDWAVVFAICTGHLGDFQNFARKLLELQR
jgi:uncharacterized protein YutE (UPF0331/DUF86 family)